MDSSQAIQLGVQHHQAGRLAEAEAVYRKILQREPHHPDALHLLGALAGQCGKRDAGIALIREAISHRPNYPEALRNLAALLAQADRYEESIAAYKKLVALWPDRADVLNDYGIVLLHENRIDEAISVLSKAIALQPELADAHRNLGNALRKKGLIDQALAASARCIELQPHGAEAHYDHALNLSSAGRSEDASAEYQVALQYKPDFEQAYNNLGKIHAEAGRLDEAIAVFSRAIQLKSASAKLYFNFGQALCQQNRLEDAIAAYRSAVQTQPDYAEAHANLAILLATMHRLDEAGASQTQAARFAPDASYTHEALGEILLHKLDAVAAAEQFRQSTTLEPDRPEGWFRLGSALQSLGKFDEAATCFRRALELRPDVLTAFQRLTATGKQVVGEAEFKKIAESLSEGHLSAEDRSSAEFALGKAADEKDRFDEAFAHYDLANSILKRHRESLGLRYDPEGFREMIDQMIDTFTQPYFEARRGWGDDSEAPVFIVGMPRSGTTLVHQIAASHPQVHGAGELADIQHIAGSMGGNDAKSAALGWRRDAITDAAKQHLKRLSELNATATRIVDKQPGNVLFLGLIPLLFPRARVIICRRDPRDTCLSCYFQNFVSSLFAFDLAHCGHQQVHVYLLMDHWLRVLPVRMLEVQYEEMVGDLEGQSRRLISFLGLPWDPACLEFHRTETAVLTFSAWQVRQPIYSRSVGRWRNYERHLGPLLKALGDIPGRRS